MLKMNQTRKFFLLNTFTAFVYQIITVIYGFIIPNLIISNYGSEMNGWLLSIINFLSLISVCEFGIGAVIKANLYKPLYENDKEQMARIMKSANRFFYKIGLIFLFYTLFIIFLFPFFRSNTFGFKETTLMILVVSLGTFSQYFFGISSQLLLEADQKGFINYIVGIFSTLIILILSITLIREKYSLLCVRCVYAIVFTIRPLCLFLYTRYTYNLQTKEVILVEEPIKQKWDGFSFHIAQVIQNNIGVMVLTAFSLLENVSVYCVYRLVTNALSLVANILIQSVTPIFGRIIASEDIERLRVNFANFEWFLHSFTCCIFGVCAVGIIPFVKLYTNGVSDVNYIRWDFGILITISTALYCLSQLYLILINVSVKFKETGKFILVEPILNIFLSVIFVGEWGLIGISIGAIVSITYKIIYLIVYLSKHIIKKRISGYLKLVFFDVFILFAVVFFSRFINVNDMFYINWFFDMMYVGIFGIIISMVLSSLLFRVEFKWFISEVSMLIAKFI